ncbi:putative phenylacetaldoxime dehydratase family protein [Penicillium brasilianum]|uniref:Putative phenylacetaldoxime dehydratase family protein n=1 Tax=Penicillium brasilianum TaxID=104259 RepID=A0A1S9RKP9_PENBI|nr:putative phenylacetaldoxime dehydratase family protein [Penicillium brasilianum]
MSHSSRNSRPTFNIIRTTNIFPYSEQNQRTLIQKVQIFNYSTSQNLQTTATEAMCTRRLPLRQPPGHNPPPRLHLKFPEDLNRVLTAYIGIQLHSTSVDDIQKSTSLLEQPVAQIQGWLANPEFSPVSTEQFQLLDDSTTHALSRGNAISSSHSPIKSSSAITSLIWVCYWTDETKYKSSLQNLNLPGIYHALDTPSKTHIGLWLEHFASDTSRLETVYSATDYLPGLARLPGTSTAHHVHTGYWGAARDRIPGSAEDSFEGDPSGSNRDSDLPEDLSNATIQARSLGTHITGTNTHNMVHIRSGQFWGNCNDEEANAYLNILEPKLCAGLSYLWNAPEEARSSGVRYLHNIEPLSDDSGYNSVSIVHQTKEACVTAFFNNMADLEGWAAQHPSHLAIWAGAIKHGKRFGDERKFRTWHEVSVLKGGEARFEYLNCLEGTGVSKAMILLDTRTL